MIHSKISHPANSERDCTQQRLAYSVAEAGELTGLGRTTLYELNKTGRLPFVKVGKRTLIRHDALDSLLAGNENA